MAATEEAKVDIEQSLKQLRRQIESDNHKAIIRVCDKVLKENSDNLDFCRAKCIALLHLQRNKAVVDFIKSLSQSLQQSLLFYHAYGLYLQNQNQSAQTLIESTDNTHLQPNETEALRHLQCQLSYRLSDYNNAETYLKEFTQTESNIELSTNEIATLLGLSQSNKAVQLFGKKKIDGTCTCDFVYNLALSLIVAGQLSDAKQLLTSSRNICEKAMMDSGEFSDTEIASELAMLDAINGIACQLEGDTEAALSIYQRLLSSNELTDEYLKNIVRNNISVLDVKRCTLHQSLQCYRALLTKDIKPNHSRLGAENSQLLKVYCNQFTTLLRAQQFKQAQSYLSSPLLKQQFTASQTQHELFILMKVSLRFQQGKVQSCIDLLRNFLTSDHSTYATLRTRLILVQLLISRRKYTDAIKELRGLDISNEPGTIRTILALAKRGNDNSLCLDVINDAVTHHIKTGNNPSFLLDLKREQCRLLMANQRYKDAHELAQSLLKQQPTNPALQALNVITSIHNNELSNAEGLVKDLPMSGGAIADIDTLTATIPLPTYIAKSRAMRASREAGDNDSKELDTVISYPSNEGRRGFDINLDRIADAKREKNRRRRQKKAQQFKESTQKQPVDWTPKPKTERSKKGGKSSQQRSQQKKKGKGRFTGAQGGKSGGGSLRVFDKETEKSKGRFDKRNLPSHIGSRRGGKAGGKKKT